MCHYQISHAAGSNECHFEMSSDAESNEYDSEVKSNVSVLISSLLNSDVNLNSLSGIEKNCSLCTDDSSGSLAGKVYTDTRLVTILEGSDESASKAQIQESFDWSARCIAGLNDFDQAQREDNCNVTDEMLNCDNGSSVQSSNLSYDAKIEKHKSSEESKTDVDTMESESCSSFPRLEGLSRVNFSSTAELEDTTKMSTIYNEQETGESVENIIADTSVNEEALGHGNHSTDSRFGNREKSERVSVTASFIRSAHTCCSPVRIDLEDCSKRASSGVEAKSGKKDKKSTERRRSSKKRRSLSTSEATTSASNNSEQSPNKTNETSNSKTSQSSKHFTLRRNRQLSYRSPLRSNSKNRSEYIEISPIKPVKYLKSLFADRINTCRSSTKVPTPRNVKRIRKPFIIISPATPM